MSLVIGVREAKGEPVHSPSLGGLCKDATEASRVLGEGCSHTPVCMLAPISSPCEILNGKEASRSKQDPTLDFRLR